MWVLVLLWVLLWVLLIALGRRVAILGLSRWWQRLPVRPEQLGTWRHATGDCRHGNESLRDPGRDRLEDTVNLQLITVCALSVCSVLIATATDLFSNSSASRPAHDHG